MSVIWWVVLFACPFCLWWGWLGWRRGLGRCRRALRVQIVFGWWRRTVGYGPFYVPVLLEHECREYVVKEVARGDAVQGRQELYVVDLVFL